MLFRSICLSVIWYDSIMDIAIPDEILPKDIREAYQITESTLSSDETMEAITQIRKLASKQCFISGMSAVVTDTKDLCDKEVPIYVTIAVILSLIVLSLTMDSFLVPIFFLLSIGMAIVYNLGTNVFKGEISYITQALTAVLQLGVTMDYSIFLWHSYQEEKKVNGKENKEAMADAIASTFSSVIGSSITTVAGFVALCFMTFTLGLDLGIVMAKGVVIGVICCVTVLPSMILIFDKPIEKTCHRALLPKFDKLSKFIVNKYWIFHILFLILLVPALYGYTHTDVYYNLDSSSHCVFTSSLATLYSDMTNISFHSPLSSLDFKSCGIILCGIIGPTTDSRPSTVLTPLTFLISEITLLILFSSRLLSSRIICVEFILNSSSSFWFA